ncbi:MAG: Acyl-CoA thioester hydrolase YbgC [Pelotomaculum sp. PtaU1.Bin035]|nr:MAG: Acyl-CoA thioester hydrolase YbgC [Pelotomaculum sp. PtaU1.Bin035]
MILVFNRFIMWYDTVKFVITDTFFAGFAPGGIIFTGGCSMEIRVYYEDTDAGGVVYYSNYLKYFERGRTEYLRERGFSVYEMARRGFVFTVVHLEIDYRAPALHDDLLRVETVVLEIGKSSISFAQRVLRVIDGKLLVDGKVKLVCVGPGMKPKRLPEEIIQAVKE